MIVAYLVNKVVNEGYQGEQKYDRREDSKGKTECYPIRPLQYLILCHFFIKDADHHIERSILIVLELDLLQDRDKPIEQ